MVVLQPLVPKQSSLVKGRWLGAYGYLLSGLGCHKTNLSTGQLFSYILDSKFWACKLLKKNKSQAQKQPIAGLQQPIAGLLTRDCGSAATNCGSGNLIKQLLCNSHSFMTKTLDVIRNHASTPDAIVEAGEMVNIRFATGASMSLRAAKLFHLLVQAAGVRVGDQVQHRLTFASLNETFHISVDDLEALIDELHGTILKIRLTDENGRTYTKSGPILSDVEREDENQPQAELRFEFSPALRKAIENSTHWAVISRKAVLAFESKYALRLYTMIALRAGLRKTSEDFMLDDLRALMGASSAYERWSNLQQKVLQPALAEINQLAGFVVGFIPLKHGKKIVGVRLTWGVKTAEDRIRALKELEASKVGRRARREGQVELIGQAEKIERQAISLALSKVTDLQ